MMATSGGPGSNAYLKRVGRLRVGRRSGGTISVKGEYQGVETHLT